MASKTASRNRALQRLKSLVQEPGPHPLDWWHRVGEQVEKICPQETRQYGKGAIASLVESLGQPDSFAAQLWAARSFFNSYTSKQVQALMMPARGSRYTLKWSHVLHLLSLDGRERGEFQKRCIREEWSARELHQRLKIHRGQKGKGGRRYAIPRSAAKALRQIVDEAERWDRFREALFGDESPLLMEKQYGTATDLETLDAAIAALQQIKETVPGDVKRLQQLRRRLRRNRT